MLKLYTISTSPRLEYIVKALKSALGFEIEITTDRLSFVSCNEPKINYSLDDFDKQAYWIQPHTFIFENDISIKEIVVQEKDNTPFFFATEGILGFDLFSASFYLLSRYEEYLPYKKDEFGLYDYKQSTAYKNHFLEIPIIHDWCSWLCRLLQVKFPGFNPAKPVFSFLPTYDIDIAYQYKHHSLYRNVGGLIKDFVRLKFTSVKKRLLVLTGNLSDEFDNYEWLIEQQKESQTKSIYFFLAATKRSKYDKNILPSLSAMHDLIQTIARKASIGLHPSWQSSQSVEILKNEKKRVEAITGNKLTKSRQHYIQINFPKTYQQLIQVGIKEEYSMGYPAKNGFRASYAFPFLWYDLSNEQQTDLIIHPFCFMDASAIFGEKLTDEEFYASLNNYVNLLRKKGGQLVTVFHNHFLSDDSSKKLYSNFLLELINSGI